MLGDSAGGGCVRELEGQGKESGIRGQFPKRRKGITLIPGTSEYLKNVVRSFIPVGSGGKFTIGIHCNPGCAEN